MFYARFINNATDTPMTYENGRPYNWEAFAFETKAALQAAIDKKWEEGGNGFKISRKFVEAHFGRDFYIASDGMIFKDEQSRDEYNIWLENGGNEN